MNDPEHDPFRPWKWDRWKIATAILLALFIQFWLIAIFGWFAVEFGWINITL